MSIRGKLRRGGRRAVCRLLGHVWTPWEPSPLPGDLEDYRECQRCLAFQWRPR